VLLHPDDCDRTWNPQGLQAQRHFGGVNACMPDVDDSARKQRPSSDQSIRSSFATVTALPGPRVETGILAPLRFEINPIRGSVT